MFLRSWWSTWVISSYIPLITFWNQLLSCGCQHEFMLLTCMLSSSILWFICETWSRVPTTSQLLNYITFLFLSWKLPCLSFRYWLYAANWGLILGSCGNRFQIACNSYGYRGMLFLRWAALKTFTPVRCQESKWESWVLIACNVVLAGVGARAYPGLESWSP